MKWYILLGLLLLVFPVSASVEILNPVNKTFETKGAASLRLVIDYNVSDADGAWLDVAGNRFDVATNNFAEYFKLDESRNGGDFIIDRNIYNRFIYTFSLKATGDGKVHNMLLDDTTNKSYIDIYYSKSGNQGGWYCLDNNTYKRLRVAAEDREYDFKLVANTDGRFFTSYDVSIEEEYKGRCIIPDETIDHINWISLSSMETQGIISNQLLRAGSYYLDLGIGDYVIKAFANKSGNISSDSASISIIRGDTKEQTFCSDGTAEGNCSSEKPKYCYRSAIIDNCQQCGCESGYVCSDIGSCTASNTTTTTIAASTTQSMATTTTQQVIIDDFGKEPGTTKYYIFIVLLLILLVTVIFFVNKELKK